MTFFWRNKKESDLERFRKIFVTAKYKSVNIYVYRLSSKYKAKHRLTIENEGVVVFYFDESENLIDFRIYIK